MKRSGIIAAAALLLFAFHAQAQTERQAAPDWIVAANKPCKIWNPNPQPNESVTWSGGCEDGYASGQGVLLWTQDGKLDVEFDGVYAKGKRNGHGVMIAPDGKRFEGVWVDDELLRPSGGSI